MKKKMLNEQILIIKIQDEFTYKSVIQWEMNPTNKQSPQEKFYSIIELQRKTSISE